MEYLNYYYTAGQCFHKEQIIGFKNVSSSTFHIHDNRIKIYFFSQMLPCIALLYLSSWKQVKLNAKDKIEIKI